MHHEPADAAATLLLTELCPYGTLQERIDSASPCMDCRDTLSTTLHLAGALEYLHSRNLYHSDVKPRNVLVKALRPMSVVLADLADVKPAQQSGRLRGTPAFYSPDMVLRRAHCGPADDMWALGVTLLGMMGQQPRMPGAVRDLGEYPARCAEHARRLADLNPGTGAVVELLVRLLAEDEGRRMRSGECAQVARAMCDGYRQRGGAGFRIRSPDDFQPRAFW